MTVSDPAAPPPSRPAVGIRAQDRATQAYFRQKVRAICEDLAARKAHNAEPAQLRTPPSAEQPPAPPITPWRERLWGGGGTLRPEQPPARPVASWRERLWGAL